MKLEKIINACKEWHRNADIIARGIGKDNAKQIIDPQSMDNLPYYDGLKEDRLAYGEPEVLLLLMPIYIGVEICKGISFFYSKLR